MNTILLTSLVAILFTQAIKYPIALVTNRHKVKVNIVMTTGGMPSSHSAAVSSLITSLVLEYGFESPLVAIATIFGVIVMFDSMGVRRQSGEQGLLLNLLAKRSLQDPEIQADFRRLQESHDIDHYEDMIIEKYLGHRPTEVVVGVLVGVLVAFVSRAIYLSL